MNQRGFGTTAADPTAWILAQRPQVSLELDPWRPQACFLEDEPAASGRILKSAVILLTNKECPWHCLMCDLWKHTLPQTVPLGAIPAQIELGLKQLGSAPEQIKLYNSGSFFDPAAIPRADYPAIARAVGQVSNLVVECHPRLVDARILHFRDLLKGSLEVAMGLETIHPEVLPRLNKRFDPGHFERAARFLAKEHIAMRAFVLLNPPFLTRQEGLEWALKSVEFAFDCGATAVSIIPTRPGNGAMEQLLSTGEFVVPRITELEAAIETGLALNRGRVFADCWDLQQFSVCAACLEQRRERLQAMNLIQKIVPTVRCEACAPINPAK